MTAIPAKSHIINLDTWPRKDIYQSFRNCDNPTYSTTVPLNIEKVHLYSKKNHCSFFTAMSYCISSAINSVSALRKREVNGQLVEFERIDPSFTVLNEDESLSFCDSWHYDSLDKFIAQYQSDIQSMKSGVNNASFPSKDHRFFITSVPWFHFSSFTHPFNQDYQWIPIITIGKYKKIQGELIAPIAIQVNHGTVDGIHLAQFFAAIENQIDKIDPHIKYLT